MSLAALILAAGASSRMGTPKALLEFQGETFLDRLIGLFAPHCSPVLVVLGHQPDRIRAALRRTAQVCFIHNPDYPQGQFTSLQCGLRALPPEADGVLFAPVDYPALQPSTIARLVQHAQIIPAPLLVIPRFHGRRGHPVCCSRQLIPELLALGPDSQARVVIHRHLDDTCYVDVEDPGILEDVDDPESYRRLIQPAPPQ